MNLVERAKEYWAVGIAIVFCAGFSLAWFIANEVLIKPRDFELERLQKMINELRGGLAPPTSGVGVSGVPPVTNSPKPGDLRVPLDDKVMPARSGILAEKSNAMPSATPAGVVREGSARELTKYLDRLPPLQREKVIAEFYLNKLVRWQGKLSNVSTRQGSTTQDRFIVAASETDGGWPLTAIFFDARWSEKLQPLRQGDIVAFEGTITKVDAGTVVLQGINIEMRLRKK